MNRKNGNGNTTISNLDSEHRSLVVEYNDSTAPYPADKTVVELFEAQVARTPNDEAVRLGDRSLSYAQLNERTNQLAAHLRTLGAGPERLVALYMEHSIEIVCAILGVLKAGAAYVPVDPATTPTDRLVFILKDISQGTAACGALPVLVTHSRLLSTLPRDAAEVVTLHSDFTQIEQYPASNPQPAASPRNLAYVIYTSGSTGKPKGVLIEHRSLVNYIWWAKHKYCQGERLTWPLFSSLAFDLTVTSIFTPLISGGRVEIYREDPGVHGMAVLKVVEDRAVDIVKLTPSHLSMIKDMNLGATRIRKLIVGGEDFKTELARDITRKFGRAVEIYNEYGPTEATVGCMIHCYDPEKDCGPSVPIGIPAANVGVYILDEHLHPVPLGATGEMYLAGDGLARGYLNRPELTEQKFLTAEDPRQHGPATQSSLSKPHALRLYKTGDVARWSADGRMEFLGRADHQVKIGGMRIELGEIEARLMTHPGIRECVVDVARSGTVKAPQDFPLRALGGTPGQETRSEAMKELEDEIDSARVKEIMGRIVDTEQPPADETGIDRLVAYYVSEKPLTVAEVRAHLAKELPNYMVPPYVVRLEKVPLTPNGKIDRKALPIPSHEHIQPAHDFVRPQTETEKALALIWTELLKVDKIGINDDFFDLGGHSLLAIRAVSRIRDVLGVDISLQTIFENPTISGLANVLTAAKGSGTVRRIERRKTSPLVRIQAGGTSRRPFFFLHGQFNGRGLYCKALAPLLGQEQPFYVFHPLPAGDDLPATVELMAKLYVQVLREAQPHGPYLLGGHCNGGLIAFEMAQRLRAQGEKVELLVLIETVARNHEFRTHRKLVSLAARLLRMSPTDELEYFFRLRDLSSHFRGLSSLQRAKFLVRKTSALPRVAKSAIRLLGHRFRSNGTPSDPQDIAASPDEWEQEELNTHCGRLVYGYVPRPYAGRLTVFRARDEKHATDDPAMGWRSLAQEVDPHIIPGDHHGCISENLPILAEHLKSCLDACHGASQDPDATQEEHLLLA